MPCLRVSNVGTYARVGHRSPFGVFAAGVTRWEQELGAKRRTTRPSASGREGTTETYHTEVEAAHIPARLADCLTRVYRGLSRAELRSRQVNRLTCGPQLGRHPYQVSEGIGLHLLHHLATVCLNRDLADAELASDLFV